MPFKELTDTRPQNNRILILGAINTYKTTCILKTFPRPLHFIVYPGEAGTEPLLKGNKDPDLKVHIYEEEDPSKVSYSTQIADIERRTWEILMGKYGPIKCFAGDGLHWLAGLYWNDEYIKLQSQYEKQLGEGKITLNDLQLKAYGNERFGTTHRMLSYIRRILQSSVEVAVITCWEGIETGQFGNKDLDAVVEVKPKPHIFAELPGRLARFMPGVFPIVVRSEVSNLVDSKTGKVTTEGTWQIRKDGRVHGVGVKIPYEQALKLPLKVPQDWSKLQELLTQ